MIDAVRVTIRRDSAANWAAKNPVLGLNEHGYETDNLILPVRTDAAKYKIGDGDTAWNDLPYENSMSTVTVLESLADISVKYATTGNLTANYANGTLGVGRTLTATTNVVFPVTDGQTPQVGDQVLVWKQSNKKQNGPFTLTSLGVAGVSPWVLTGDTSGDESAELDEQVIFVIHGPANGNKYYTQQTPVPVVGTSPIIYKKGVGGNQSNSTDLKIELTAAQVKALFTTPQNLIEGISSGYFVRPMTIVILNTFGTTAFNFAGGTQFLIEYSDGQNLYTFSDDFSNVVTTGKLFLPDPQRFLDGGLPDGLNVRLKASADATVGDGTWTIYIKYLQTLI